MAQLTGVALAKSITNSNITTGFRTTFIYPFNCNVFDGSKYLPADATGQPTDPALQSYSFAPKTSNADPQ